mgnify:CR=1 FL=1
MAERRQMIEPNHPKLSTARQCRLLGLPRSSYYRRPNPKPVEDLALMRVIDEVYLAQPVFGYMGWGAPRLHLVHGPARMSESERMQALQHYEQWLETELQTLRASAR